ncbi:MAG: metallophosphoesterase [Bacilli bacterium]
MSTILVVSDNHGDDSRLSRIVAHPHAKEADVWIHCGDSEFRPDHPLVAPFEAVCGNCDWGSSLPEERLVEVGEERILVTHGHLWDIKRTLTRLHFRAQEVGATIVCFGHSHIMGVERVGDILFVNPGSVLLPRGRKEGSYAVIQTGEKKTVIFYDAVTSDELAAYTL